MKEVYVRFLFMVYMMSCFFFFFCGFVFNVGCYCGNGVGRISRKEDREQGQGDNIKGLVWGVLRIN